MLPDFLTDIFWNLLGYTGPAATAEAELSDRVYRLFNLTADETKLLQKEVEH